MTDRLTKTFAETRSPEQVQRAVSDIRHRFDHRPIRDFVPVLVERYARQELSAD